MMTKLVVYFDLPDEHIKQISDISENMVIVRCTEKKEFLAHVADTEILITLFKWPDAKTVRQAPRLKWIQSLTAGVDFLPLDEIRAQGIILTSGRGIHKIYIAEYALAAMINFARNAPTMLLNQLRKKWDRSVPQGEICGSVVGILGLGSIGREIATKASVFGMRVIGVKNHPLPIECVDHVYG
ncbi:MAG: NAD(P)-dependent oxidoreductase, partial [Desulfosarcina sp.]